MTKALMLTVLTGLVLTVPAFARDDGGFGSNLRAPTALEDPVDDQLATGDLAPSDVEPAAGDDETPEPTSLDQSNQTDPVTDKTIPVSE